MTILTLIIVLIVLGLVLYLIGLLPIDAKIKQVITILFIVLVILYLLSAVFGWADIGSIRIGR
jgi:hypothetical protein